MQTTGQLFKVYFPKSKKYEKHYKQILVMQKDITQTNDLCYLQNLNEENILECLTKRYENDKIFTTIGQTLLAINPYKQISSLFEQSKLDSFKESVFGGVPNRQPHIYAVASRTFQGIINKQKKQSIVISGESGAGKTQSAKYCLKMLTHFSQQHGKVQEHLIQQKLLACNPILQAFGNSKTVRNDNSSRFGKYLQIYFDANQTVRGANIRSYLLEKTRVVYVAPEERNFHIFYALCAALNQNPSKYQFLNQSSCLSIPGKLERQSYQQIRECMDELSFPKSYQQKIEKLLISILMMGNLQFDDSEYEKDVNAPCRVKNHQLLMEIASILECDQSTLINCFVKSRIQMPKEVIMKSLDKNECIFNRNTLCKVFYNSIFESVINKMNEAMTPDRNFEVSYRLSSSMYSREANINSTFEINILDIFGFENFNENSLQQLCINYTNQKLLNIYNKSVFQNELQQLREDQIDVQLLTPPTAEPKIALLQEVFKIIKEKTLIRQFKDEDIISAFKTNRENSSHIRTIQYDKLNNKKFLIKHSPVDITYSVVNFKSKNQDKVSEDIQNIYAHIIPQFQQSQQARTLLQKFTIDIRSLTEELQSAQNHYVRCIKPNDRKRNEVNHDFMMRQIRYLGVFQTIKIRKSVFPYRKTYDQFCLIYRDVFKNNQVLNSREKALFIMKQVQASTQLYMFGNRRIYLSTDIQEKLNSKLVEFQKLKKIMANKIIKAFRRMKYREKFRMNIKKVLLIIKILKKWGQKIQVERKQLLFNGFTFLKQESEEKLNEKIMIEFYNSMNQQLELSEISRFEGQDNGNVYQTVGRLKSLSIQSKIFYKENQSKSQKEKIKNLNKEIENYQIVEAEMKLKITTLENQFYKLQIEKCKGDDKGKIFEREIQQLNQLINRYSQQIKQSKKSYKDSLEIQKKMQQDLQIQKGKYTILTQRLEKLQKENTQANRNLNSQILLAQSSQIQRYSLQVKMKQVEGLKKQLISKELIIQELKQKENISNVQIEQMKIKNKEIEQQISIKSKKQEENIQRIKSLQQIILNLQKAEVEYKKQNNELFKAKQEMNEKSYQKIKELQEAKNKIKKFEDKEKIKDFSKEALERIKLKVNFLQSQNQKMKKRLKQMDQQLAQHRTVNQKLREKISQVQHKQTNSHIVTNPISNENQLSQRQILQHVVSLRGTLNINQLRAFKNKIIMCLP